MSCVVLVQLIYLTSFIIFLTIQPMLTQCVCMYVCMGMYIHDRYLPSRENSILHHKSQAFACICELNTIVATRLGDATDDIKYE